MSQSRTSSNTKHSLLPSSPSHPSSSFSRYGCVWCRKIIYCHKTRRLQLTGVVTEGGALWVHYVFACAVGILGPLLASLDLGVTCVVRALKFVNGPFCKSQEGAWIRADVPTFLPRVAAGRLGCRSRMPSRLSQHG